MMSNGLGDSAGSPDAALGEVDFGFTSTMTAEGPVGTGCALSPLS